VPALEILLRREAPDLRDAPLSGLDENDRARPACGNEQAAEGNRKPEIVEADASLAVGNRDRGADRLGQGQARGEKQASDDRHRPALHGRRIRLQGNAPFTVCSHNQR
jgi:hypothetical protein